jgi:hypothetical protein
MNDQEMSIQESVLLRWKALLQELRNGAVETVVDEIDSYLDELL